jgi:hypothetical protein
LLARVRQDVNVQEVHSFAREYARKTLGQLIGILRPLVPLDHHAEQIVRVALKKRNMLAHDFFSRRMPFTVHEIGRRWLACELARSAQLFRAADFVFESTLELLLQQFKCTQEDVKRWTREEVLRARERFQ